MYDIREVLKFQRETPYHEHDCDNCEFLGTHDMSYHCNKPAGTKMGDLYVCYDEEEYSIRSLIARMGKDGDYYTFMVSNAVVMYAARLIGQEIDPYFLPATEIIARYTALRRRLHCSVEISELERVLTGKGLAHSFMIGGQSNGA